MKPIDISTPVAPGVTPRWPGSPEIAFSPELRIADGDPADDTTITMNIHTGTHIDAPSHFVPGAPTVEQVSLERLVGPCRVVSFEGLAKIDAAALEAADIPAGTTRLLCKTDNEPRWASEVFDEDFVGFSVDGAKWLVEHGIELVGIDYLSVQPYRESDEVHHTLLGAHVVVVEGLRLGHVNPGAYSLVCLPLKLSGVEGAPARAILLPSVGRAE